MPNIEIPWPLLLGPYALTVGLVILIVLIMRAEFIPKRFVLREDYDRAMTVGEEAVEANEKLSESVEERNRLEAARLEAEKEERLERRAAAASHRGRHE